MGLSRCCSSTSHNQLSWKTCLSASSNQLEGVACGLDTLSNVSCMLLLANPAVCLCS